jgi:hypothetical protein
MSGQWVIALTDSQYLNGEYLIDAWQDGRGRYHFEFDVADESGDVLTWTTRGQAQAAFDGYNLDPERVQVRHWQDKTGQCA